MKKVQITETVLRDANQSLMATRLPYSDFAEILPEMNKAGYYSVECWGGATFDTCLRYLGEDPWQRLRDIRKAMPDTKLQMLLRGQNLLGYKHYHDDVVEKFVELSIKNGIDILRIFDALNDFRNIATALEATKKYATKNTVASGCISYTQSPVHTVEKYVEMCKELKNMGFDTICLKDMAGTMSPYEAEHLIKGSKDAVGDVPLILHTHCTTGLAFMTYLKAVEAGADVIDTAIETIVKPTVQAMADEGTPFTGILYAGLIATADGPKVIEYNARFGDPETQVVLPLLESDLLTVMEATTNGTLDKTEVKFSDGAAACVVLASGGYPVAYEKGKEITGLENGQVPGAADVTVYHAGTAIKDGKLVTNGGRVLGVTATAATLPEALKKAYAAADCIHFDKLHRRSDIGARALAAMKAQEG